MKLLFDQNLSPRLVALLGDVFAGSLHVREAGLDRASDESIWRFARNNGYAIVTKDSDFQERNQIVGVGPRVVWIRRGNSSTQAIEFMLRAHALRIAALDEETEGGYLILV